MKVSQLVAKLQGMGPDREVVIRYDGDLYKVNQVIIDLCKDNEHSYSTKDLIGEFVVEIEYDEYM